MKAVIFDLDGVIVTTDELHYLAWQSIANEEGIEFTREDNELLRGVSRMESLEIILNKSQKNYHQKDKEKMAEKKNNIYKALLKGLTQDNIFNGVVEMIQALKEKGVRLGIGSSSKNTVAILKQIGLYYEFNFIADGTMIEHSKPNPEVFLLAAHGLGVLPQECIVVEDAMSGIEAAINAKMKCIGIGEFANADLSVASFDELNLEDFMSLFDKE